MSEWVREGGRGGGREGGKGAYLLLIHRLEHEVYKRCIELRVQYPLLVTLHLHP